MCNCKKTYDWVDPCCCDEYERPNKCECKKAYSWMDCSCNKCEEHEECNYKRPFSWMDCSCNECNKCNEYEKYNCMCMDMTCLGGSSMGGWNIDVKEPCEINPTLYRCLNSALNNITGVSYTMVSYLGCQLVNGTNYAVLARGTTSTNPPTTILYVVVINRDLNGNCTIVSSTPILG